ncbi:MAG: zinc-dependent metalloprotease [Rhodothermales bacterium]|nr:zinc-dependent metalloprotease [Rhodothermales bacterium]
MILCVTGFLHFGQIAIGQVDEQSIDDFTASFESNEGFFDVYWDAAEGKIWLQIDRFNEPFLYLTSLPAGLGSNDIGLDRGLLGSERIVHFERIGPKVLLVAPNLDYRSTSSNAAEVKAVEDAFARSILWGFDIKSESDGSVLVDVTPFVVRDAQGIVNRLSGSGQGSFNVDQSRSTPNPEVIKSFPENAELEAWLTLTSNRPGGLVRSVAADASTFTLRVRHSFIKLPDANYVPRQDDPRYGFGATSFADYSTPIGERLQKRYIARHRLEKENPGRAPSRVKDPIIYYLDPGTPEPVRSALLDGGRWWADAFEAAGFIDAYRVEMLPDGADMLDVRYNVIQWVHRSTRGWSYGNSVVDPRTGEIMKGHVSLGSLRVRQDYLIAEGLLGPYGDGASRISQEALEMALARIRQLSAHEIGHTLGLSHNFATSAYGRESVMDYPAPLASVSFDGSIDLSQAYDVGIGDWDKRSIMYGYGDWGDDTDAMLDSLLNDASRNGLVFITDMDARPLGGAHPLAHLWDNGDDIIAALDREMDVRQVALDNFGTDVLQAGSPLALLEETLVPLYLRHRYQIEAVSKLVGGVNYSYSIKGDETPAPAPVDAVVQNQAIDALLGLLSPAVLRIPDNIASMIPPRPPGFWPNRELFDGYTGLTFDPYAPAEAAVDMVVAVLLQRERSARLIQQKDYDSSQPGLTGLLDRGMDVVFDGATSRNPVDAELERMVQIQWSRAVMSMAADRAASPAVAARSIQHLKDIVAWLERSQSRDEETTAHRNFLSDEIERFLFRQFSGEVPETSLDTPPGSPIGG